MSLQDKLKAMLQSKTEEQEKFLQDNAAKEGVVTLPSGLQYLVLKPGDGAKPGRQRWLLFIMKVA
jgi:FKBP-type peptidyl-prolyl cis-trans isomerase FklB